jgi:hypothetical protein
MVPRCGLNSSGSVVGSCKYGNDPSGPIKGCELFDQSASQGLYSTELDIPIEDYKKHTIQPPTPVVCKPHF